MIFQYIELRFIIINPRELAFRASPDYFRLYRRSRAILNLLHGFGIVLRSLLRIFLLCRSSLTAFSPWRQYTASILTTKFPTEQYQPFLRFDPYVFFGQGIFIDCVLLITRSYFLLTMFLHKISSNITCHFSCCGGCEWLHSLQYENIFSICLYKANNGDYETKTMVEKRITTNITWPAVRAVVGHGQARLEPCTHTDWTWPGPAWP